MLVSVFTVRSLFFDTSLILINGKHFTQTPSLQIETISCLEPYMLSFQGSLLALGF